MPFGLVHTPSSIEPTPILAISMMSPVKSNYGLTPELRTGGPGVHTKGDGYNDDPEKSGFETDTQTVEATILPELEPIREKKLTRKLDWYLIPIFCVSDQLSLLPVIGHRRGQDSRMSFS